MKYKLKLSEVRGLMSIICSQVVQKKKKNLNAYIKRKEMI